MSAGSLLEIRNLSKNFSGLEVIADVSFSVDKAERVALIGPNGAGKTTIFNLVTGVYPVSQGTIALSGEDITKLPDHRRARKGIIRSFQNIRLMPHLTTIENVMLGQQVRLGSWFEQLSVIGLRSGRWRRDAAAQLEAAGLAAYAYDLVYNLPYGIQKRIELARALSAHPKLLLLDEPAAGLNPAETEDLARQLSSLSENGITLLVVEHDMHFVRRLCQRVIVFNFGKLIAKGTPAEVQRDPQVLEAYLGSDRSLEAGHAA